jgi:hypothetical protein
MCFQVFSSIVIRYQNAIEALLMPNLLQKQELSRSSSRGRALGCLQRIAAFSFGTNAGENQPFDTQVPGLVADLIVDELGVLHELFPALIRVGLEGCEDAIARSLASPLSITGLLWIEMHFVKLKSGTNC